jgi:hypothetical protein
VIRGARAAATQAAAAGPAQAALDAGGSAVDAIVAGFFAAAGEEPGVLLAPAVALVAGFGVGARAFDGRAAQPGRGASRPRGFVDAASIPDAARVAAPRSLGMLVLVHGYRGRTPMRELVKPGVLAAEAAGAKARAALLRKVGAGGVLALRGAGAMGALLAAFGPIAGGLLTEEDVEGSPPVEAEAAATALGEGLTAFAPPYAPGGSGEAEAIVACDGRGAVAALAYVPARGGVAVPELEITIGRDAIPVRRGVTRVAPGTLLAAPAPVAIAVGPGSFAAAVGMPGRASVDVAVLAEVGKGAAVEAALAERAEGRGAVAVVTDGTTARTVALGRGGG